MRILYIAPRPPYPPEGRETVRPYHQIRFMALRHDVDLVCFSGGGVDEWDARERLKKLVAADESETVDFKKSKAQLPRTGETFCALLNVDEGPRVPLPLAGSYTH